MPALMAILAIEQASMPLILMVLGIIKSHVNATGKFPSEDEIIAAIPIKAEAIKDLWAQWDKTHPG